MEHRHRSMALIVASFSIVLFATPRAGAAEKPNCTETQTRQCKSSAKHKCAYQEFLPGRYPEGMNCIRHETRRQCAFDFGCRPR